VAPLRDAYARRPNDPKVLEEIGLTSVDLGDLGNALGALVRALDLDPELGDARRTLCWMLESNQLTEESPQVVRVVQALLDRDDVAPQPLVRSALNLALRRPAVQQAVASRDADPSVDAWELLPEAMLTDGLLRRVLERDLNRDPDLERLLVRLRRDFLLRAPDLTPARLSFAASLAQQAHNNEFVFVETAEEQAAVRRLVPDDARNLLRLAMYRPLTELADAEDLLRRDWPKPVAALIEGVLRPHLEELDLKRELQSFSPIEDGVSALVSDHYEHNPYPRWFSLTVPQREHRLRALEGLLGQRLATGGGKLQVLVAGGGTGKQSILAAIAYGDSAEVLAIDLSRTSLAYSMRKAREYNVRNLKHLHGDLLEVGRLPQAFDIVECTGVLVCVRDPQAALAALVAKLKPGGLIYLALYSEAARADVVAARQMIAELGIGDSPDEMRRFRHTMITGPDSPLRTELLGSPGFYSLSTCRDFLFHRVEHRFSLAQVDGLLRSCGLRFFCWDLPAGVLPRFRNRFGAAADPRDLALWEVYERENPRTFRGMYNFWCRQEG